MNFLESIRVSLRALRANKLRSILTMLGIIIGVAAVIAMVGIGKGTTNSITSQIKGLGSNLLIVTPGQTNSGGVTGALGTSNTLDMEDITKVQAAGPAVKMVAPASGKAVQVVFGAKNTSTSMTGTTDKYAQIRNTSMKVGRFLSARDIDSNARVVVLGSTVAQSLFGADQVSAVGKTIKLDNVLFQVIGVLASQGSSGSSNNDDMVLVPITTAQTRLIGNKYVKQIFIEAVSADLMQTAEDEVSVALRRAHRLQTGQPDDFTIMSQADILATMKGVTQTMTMLLGGIAAISLLVGGIGIMNIMLVSVTERTREIGIRKAIGAKERDILLQFLIEAIVLSIVGGIVGMFLGWGGSNLVGKAMKIS
ncbi:ABC transporter permease, partial [Desulfosporosinus fructosivorans]